jgi:hypothetical protein
LSSASTPDGQPVLDSPWKYHGDPLSASTSLYVFMARSTARVSAR